MRHKSAWHGWIFIAILRTVALTCRHFGISRQTFYRWLKSYEPVDLTRLEERSHCPHRCRRADLVFALRDEYTRFAQSGLHCRMS